MNNSVTILGQISFLDLLWLFFCAFVIHELEEWNIDRFEHRHFEGVPPAATDKSARLWIAFVCLAGLIWCLAATLPGNPGTAAWILLPAIAILIQNALQHIFWTCYFRRYAPGIITAALLLIPLGGYVLFRAMEQEYVPIWYLTIWVAFIGIGCIQTVSAGNQMPSQIRAINRIGIWLADRIR
jgi:hypothetical protein